MPALFRWPGRIKPGTESAAILSTLDVLPLYWSGEPFSYEGSAWSAREVIGRPRPHQNPIPIWLGGASDAVLKRAARLADGWMPIIAPDAQAEQKLALLDDELRRHGRDRASFGLEGWLRMNDSDPLRWAAAAQSWRRLGADTVMLYPMFRIPTVEAQIDILRQFKATVRPDSPLAPCPGRF